MKKIKNYIINFTKIYCYIIIPVLTTAILVILKFKSIWNLPEESIENYLSAIVGISGSLVGFLFTAMTIFFSLNKDSQYMKNFKKYNHHIIFSRLVTFGIVSLCLNIVCWLFQANIYLIVLLFIVGLEESIMSSYYIYKVSLNSFK